MATWNIDPTHSEVQFKVKHLVISTVTGSFDTFSATLEASADDFSDAKVTFSADVDSINTRNAQRDGHLKSGDFFDAAQYPTLSFESTKIEKAGSDYKLSGNLTIRNTTLPVVLDVDYGGTTVDPYGQTKAGFEISGKVNRKDFGLTWSALTEAGGLVVGDDIRLQLSVQMVKA
ncbi:MAG: polyisoprenoid-binding protein [Bacteroidetes bacterium]|nr:MAG: polyisoprenoid-binding protein [Bacteroidota bacterium]